MADADEDDIRNVAQDVENVDLSDETQDFRFLSSLSQFKLGEAPSLPRRGEKDFEQHGLRAQDEVLAASRQAMRTALSFTRLHKPGSLIGLYDPSQHGSCVVPHPKGSNLQNLGRNDSQGQMHLVPEEALYLLERGSLNILWADAKNHDIPLTLEAAYTYFIGCQGLTLERYLVFAGLKRSGYIVQRAPTWDASEHDRLSASAPQNHAPDRKQSIYEQLWTFISLKINPTGNRSASGPLILPGLFHSYPSIYKQLRLIPFHDPSNTTPYHNDVRAMRHPSIRPTYYVWKPTAAFRKTAPPPPDYRICVMNARKDAFPALEQVEDLMACMPYDPPPESSRGKTYVRLRHGYKRFIIAVVDQGIISYVSLTDSGFGCEPVWHTGSRGRGGKGGRGGSALRGRRGG